MTTGDSNSHDLLVAKCVALAVMFCATCLFGAIPYMLNCCLKWTDKGPNTRSAKVVTWLLYFGGGVLLATTFIHILPDVEGVVAHLQECGQIETVRFAVPEVLMCAGFFLMYLIEEIVHMCLHTKTKKKSKKDGDDDSVEAAFERGYSVRNSVLVKQGKGMDGEQNVGQDNANYQGSNDNLANTTSDNGYSRHVDLEKRSQQLEVPSNNPRQPHDHGGHGHSHMPVATNEDDTVVRSSLRGLGIVLALSLHEAFEGLAVGLQDTTGSVWFLFAAVSAHKLVLAFCVGVELIVARTRTSLAVVYIVTFAIVSPIGVAIGIGVSHNSNSSDDSVTSMVLQGIACGTLLYVVFFEILNKKHPGFGAFIAMLIGYCVMFGLQNIGEPASSDENECAGSVAPSTAATLMDMTTTALMNMTTTTMPTTTTTGV